MQDGQLLVVAEDDGDMPRRSSDVPKRWRKGLMGRLESADTLRAGSPLRKELERGLEVEKRNTHLSSCLGRR